MFTIMESKRFCIAVHAAPDYKGVERYRVVYGLQCTPADTLPAAVAVFNDCVNHALNCEGYTDE